MSSEEVCASGMLSFVRQVLKETTDYGSLTIRELRNKYTKSMGITSLKSDEKETFRAIVDQAIMEHEVEQEEQKSGNAKEPHEFQSPIKDQRPKADVIESPLVLKKRCRKMSLSDEEDDKNEITRRKDIRNSTEDASILGLTEQDMQQETETGMEVQDDCVFHERENEDSDGGGFYVKKKKKKRKLKRYSLDSNISNSDSSEKKLTIPRIKLVRDYSAKPKPDNNSDIDEFINSVVKAATVNVDSESKVSMTTNNLEAVSSVINRQEPLVMNDRTRSEQATDSEEVDDVTPTKASQVSKVLGSDSDGSDSDDQPLSVYRSSSSIGKKDMSSLPSSADRVWDLSCENNTGNPSKRFKRNASDDGLCDVGDDSIELQKNEEDSNLTDISNEESTMDSMKLKRKKREGKGEAVGNGAKKNSEDHHIQRYKKYLNEAGIRVSYKKLFEGCTTLKAKIQKLKEKLEVAGVEGRPTLEKCRKIKKKREREQELASLDKSNIIGSEGISRLTNEKLIKADPNATPAGLSFNRQ